MRLFVCPLEALEQTLAASGARHLVSLSGPGKAIEKPQGVDEFLALEFNDIAEPRDGLIPPSLAHVKLIVDFSKAVPEDEGIMFQCWMGISRSTAAAIIAGLVLRPELSPQSIVQTLRHKSSSATPNPLMIAHADGLLDCKGELVQAVREIGRGVDAYLGEPFSIDLETIT